MVKKIISNLPSNICVKYKEWKTVYTSYGIVTNYAEGYDVKDTIRPLESSFYVTIDNDGLTLVLSYVDVISNENEVMFNGVEVARYNYNQVFRELNVEYEEIRELFMCEDEADTNQKRNEIFEGLRNPEVFINFVADMVKGDTYCERLSENMGMIFNPVQLFSLYLSKVNKAFDLLMDNEMWYEIEVLLKKRIEYDRFGYDINSKTIRLAKKLEVGQSGVIIASKLLNKYNYNEIESLMKIAAYFKFSTLEFWNLINDLDVNLTEFTNYLLKSLFVNNNMKLNYYASNGMFYNIVVGWVRELYDYHRMKEIDEPIYPDNLKEAHDLAVNSFERKRQEKIEEERKEAFVKRVNDYDYLCHVTEGYKFVIPNTPDDLIEEGRRMCHCVGGYISNVISGQSKIVFVKKEDEPYITIEVRGNNIVQAKKNKNELPNKKDDRLIRDWAKLKELSVSSY